MKTRLLKFFGNPTSETVNELRTENFEKYIISVCGRQRDRFDGIRVKRKAEERIGYQFSIGYK